jgi:hypothetical protein
MPLFVATLLLLSVMGLFALSMIASRRGATRSHKVAFYAGLIGLVAVPAWLISFAGVATQIPYITLDGIFGALFIASGAILFCAVCMCVLALLSIHHDSRRAA